MDTIQAITQRFSYRGKYAETKVPKEDLRIILQAGIDAPSGCNAQTTSFVCVDDKEVLEKLNSVMEISCTKTAPAIIYIITKKVIVFNNKSYAVQDYSAAIENILLAAVALGYQSCWLEGYVSGTDKGIDKKVAEILNVPSEYEVVCALPIGIATGEVRKPEKKPFEQRAFFNSFNSAAKAE